MTPSPFEDKPRRKKTAKRSALIQGGGGPSPSEGVDHRVQKKKNLRPIRGEVITLGGGGEKGGGTDGQKVIETREKSIPKGNGQVFQQ